MKREEKDDVFISGRPFKVIATIVDEEYVSWKFSSKKKGNEGEFVICPHHLTKNKEKEHYDINLNGKKQGMLIGSKPPKYAGMVIRTDKDLLYPMLNGYICVTNYGPNGENGFITFEEFNRISRLYKIIATNNKGQPVLVSKRKHCKFVKGHPLE